MDMTPQAWPDWYDGKHINEVLFCQQFLDKHPMKCVRGRLFTVDGLIEDEGQIGNLILEEISGVLTSGLSKVVTNLLASIKLQAYSPPLPIETDRIVCTHIDRAHVHNHIIWNSTSLDCTRKFRNFWGSTRAVRRLSDTLCIENGLSIVEDPKPKGQTYDKWLGTQAKPSHRELLRQAIDRAMERGPEDLEALLKLLQEAGFSAKRRGKDIAFRAPGWKNVVCLKTLGDGYGEADLCAALTGKHKHVPARRAAPAPAVPKVNLLVDIQAKLRAGKGAGYARWASKFNLKQMAQTLNYLNDHGLLDYKVLAEKTVAATARRNELSEKIKAAEKRMAEIAVLRTHIVNYAKTRDTYAAYRKAGYSPKFRSEHEADILLHQAAKQAFDQLNVKKLPKMKALQAEYAALLAEKKEAYAELRKARDEARELLTVKANVDRVLQDTGRGIAQEKEHSQR